MGSITNFLEKELLDHVFNTSYTPPSTVYLALCTADPGEGATGASCNEVANQYGYARTAITFAAAASRVVDQSGAVTFPQASGGGWGTVTHWVILSSNTYGEGDALGHGAFGSSKVINDGDTPSVASGEIDVTVSANEVSDYLANKWLDFAFRNQAFTSPDTYVALCTATVADNDTGSSITEPSGYGYARKQVNPNGGAAPDWNNATGDDPALVDNNDEIAFPQASGGNWGTIVAVAICDASTAGNLLMYDNAMTDKDVNDGDTAKFPAGDLDCTLT